MLHKPLKTNATFEKVCTKVLFPWYLECGGLPPLSKAGASSRTPKALRNDATA
jgi:hypothetical protein